MAVWKVHLICRAVGVRVSKGLQEHRIGLNGLNALNQRLQVFPLLRFIGVIDIVQIDMHDAHALQALLAKGVRHRRRRCIALHQSLHRMVADLHCIGMGAADADEGAQAGQQPQAVYFSKGF